MEQKAGMGHLQDEVPGEVTRMSLENSHFERALEVIKPTVSDIMIRELTPFTERSGGDVRKLYASPPKDDTSESGMEQVC